MENHDSRSAHSPEASTDERAFVLNPRPAGDHVGCVRPDEPDEGAGAAEPPPSAPAADQRFTSEPEERAYWAGVRIGMENAAAARAAQASGTAAQDAPAQRQALAPGDPCPEPPPLISDTLAQLSAETIQDTVEASFPLGSRKPRHDGFTPEKMGEFLRHLAATGVVEHAAAAVRISAQAAYALRNRRQGRAFARMWDAILVNRARHRLASELSSRAIAGCVSIRKKDGVIVSEYHHYDNRLAMSMLTRLDRLAEREADSEAHLRALSEDMEAFIDCLAIGEDADAFVERRRPAPPPEPALEAPNPTAAAPFEPPEPEVEDPFPDVATYARICRVPDYLGIPPRDIPVADLDLDTKEFWSPDQDIRFYRSGFAPWLAIAQDGKEPLPAGLGAALQFDTTRRAVADARATYGATPAGPDEMIETADLEDADVADWTPDQRARAWRSGFLSALPAQFWEACAGVGEEDEEELT